MVKGGCVWDTTRYGDTINERAVRILLESCILVIDQRASCLNILKYVDYYRLQTKFGAT